MPVICGSAFKNKGVQPLLDAVVDFLPSPLEIPSVTGIDPNGAEGATTERPAKDDAPLSALAFKIMTDPFVGQLTFIRVYSGVMTSGMAVYNATKQKTERIGRLLKMHANKREEIKEVYAGDIAAAVGLKSVSTGDTVCDEKTPVILEAMDFPEPVISLAIEPKTKSDQEKLGMGLAKLMAEDPTFRVKTDDGNRSGRHRRHGRAAPRDHRRPPEARVQRRGVGRRAAGRLQGNRSRAPPRAKAATSSRPAAAASTATRRSASFRASPARATSSRTTSSAASIPEGIHQADRPGHSRGDDDRRARRLSDGRREDRALRRVVPRRRLERNGVQDRRIDGVQGRGEEGAPGAARAGDARRGRRARGIHGRRHRRHHSRRGHLQSMEARGGSQVINSRVPLSEMFGYATDIRSRTQGRGSYSMHFDRYEPAPASVSEEVIAKVQGK